MEGMHRIHKPHVCQSSRLEAHSGIPKCWISRWLKRHANRTLHTSAAGRGNSKTQRRRLRGVLSSATWVIAAATFLGVSSAQQTSQDVKIDLAPCVFSNGTVKADVGGVTEAYLLSQFFEGFWGSTQVEVDATSDTFDLDAELTESGDEYHGKCNVVYVGFPPSADQYASLQLYSQRFQVRIIYLIEADTANDSTSRTKLGVTSWFGLPFYNTTSGMSQITGIKLSDQDSRLINPYLETNPLENNVYVTPMIVVGEGVGGTVSVMADYHDAAGKLNLTQTYEVGTETEYNVTYPSAAVVTYSGEGGEEEMHVFFNLAWFDVGSWAWAHYINEWGTKGIFQGERRFWLAGQVDDLFLSTNVFEWDGVSNAADTTERVSSSDLAALLDGTAALNAEYNSDIITEFPFNGIGILDKVRSEYIYSFDDADAALLIKGEPPTDNGDGTFGLPSMISPANWWSQSRLDGMKAEFEDGLWATDDLLNASLALKDDFHWQSHTMSHLARDNLGEEDCVMEDGANAWIAVITGLFDASTYNWRSMTNPGITGLFNKNCLKSAMDNLMTCGPGDNTYIGAATNVSLVSNVSQFHSIYTTESTNGLDGFQIAPRFATYIYYNCKTTDCLVLENLFIRRTVCKCTDTSPGTMDNLNLDMTGCNMDASGCAMPEGVDDDFQAFQTIENLFDTEAESTVRYLLSGRRDKYMFHQANVVPTEVPNSSGTTSQESLLLYWYRLVLEELSQYINIKDVINPFPVRSVKFDDLCTSFKYHEELDASLSVVTMTKTSAGGIIDMEISNTGSAAGVVPVTVPTTTAEIVTASGWTMNVYGRESYGSDTTYYATTSDGIVPADAVKPTSADLPAPPLHTPAPTPGPTPAPTPAPSPAPTPAPTPSPTQAPQNTVSIRGGGSPNRRRGDGRGNN